MTQLVSEEGIRGRKTFTYSRQGSILKEEGMSGTRRFRYNSKNQQIRVEREDGRVQENLYDAEGLRYGMREDGQFIRFAYHSGELLYEGGENNQTSYHLGAGIEAFRRGGETCYYHQDEQLSTALVTGQTGESQNHYQYDAFGNELEKSEQISNRIRYTGQQYDQVTGQYYLRARYYNPLLGRFMQEDVYQGDGLNLYAYCHNNPVMYYDPSGYTGEEYENAKFGETDNQEEAGDSLWNPTEKKNDLWAKGKLKEHFDKHGGEFGAKSSQEYSDMAVEFGTRTSDGGIIQTTYEAFVYRYEPSTNAVFIGTKGGRIKTFYIYDGREDDFVIKILKALGLLK